MRTSFEPQSILLQLPVTDIPAPQSQQLYTSSDCAQARSESTTDEPKVSRTLDLIATARGDKAKKAKPAEAAHGRYLRRKRS